jgi:hypothetical protein
MKNKNDEVSINDLLTGSVIWGKYFLSRLWIITLIGGGMAAVAGYKAYKTNTTYTAQLDFIIDEDEGASMGGVGSILGQFGLGGSSAGRYNIPKIIRIAESNRISEKSLRRKIIVDEVSKTIAEHIVDIYDLRSKWEKSDVPLYSYDLRDFRGEITDTMLYRSALLELHNTLHGKSSEAAPLIGISEDESSGFITVKATTISEQLSIGTCKEIYENISQFYKLQSIKRQQNTVKKLQSKVDSVSSALRSKEAQLARELDSGKSIQLKQNFTRRQALTRDVSILTLIYSESIKNLETASFILSTSSPAFQVIDSPFMPIQPNGRKILKSTITWGIVGTFLTLGILSLIRLYNQAVDEQTNPQT